MITFGELVDRLQIINIKIYSLIEITANNNISDKKRVAVEHNIHILNAQRKDLIDELDRYIDDVIKKKREHKLYPRLKSYKDF
jgi:hypothetical protein